MTDLQERTAKPIGFTAMKQWLRHRHPMIFLDRILDHEPGEFLNALLVVSGGLDAISGHFPDRAIYPGSHLIQAFAQGGIILYQMSTTLLGEDELTLIASTEARFFRVVVPGDQVIFRIKVDHIRGTVFHFSAEAMVGAHRVAALRATLARVQISQLENVLW